MNLEKRIATALALIRQVVGDDEADEIAAKLGPNKQEYGKAISLSGLQGSADKKGRDEQRVAVRALLLAGLYLGKTMVAQVQPLKQELLNTATDRLHRNLQHFFPFRPFRGRFANRMLWAPEYFTDPKNHNPSSYRYLIHGIMAGASYVAEFATKGTIEGAVKKEEWDQLLEKYRASVREIKEKKMGPVESQKLWVKFARLYLQDLTIVKRNILSVSLISHKKHASYYPFGFILRVPPACVYSTAPKDQAVKNRATDAVKELQRVYQGPGADRIWTPDEILDATTGTQGKTGYNEIVVVGKAPEGHEIEVIALYVKTHPNGNYYVDPQQKTRFVDADLEKLIKGCISTKGIPVVKIPDASSDPSTDNIPF